MKKLNAIAEQLARAALGEPLRDTTLIAAVEIQDSVSASPAEKIAAHVMGHAFDLIQRFKIDQEQGTRDAKARPADDYPIERLGVVIENALHELECAR